VVGPLVMVSRCQGKNPRLAGPQPTVVPLSEMQSDRLIVALKSGNADGAKGTTS
jgi:hypothetical protein